LEALTKHGLELVDSNRNLVPNLNDRT